MTCVLIRQRQIWLQTGVASESFIACMDCQSVHVVGKVDKTHGLPTFVRFMTGCLVKSTSGACARSRCLCIAGGRVMGNALRWGVGDSAGVCRLKLLCCFLTLELYMCPWWTSYQPVVLTRCSLCWLRTAWFQNTCVKAHKVKHSLSSCPVVCVSNNPDQACMWYELSCPVISPRALHCCGCQSGWQSCGWYLCSAKAAMVHPLLYLRTGSSTTRQWKCSVSVAHWKRQVPFVLPTLERVIFSLSGPT